MKRLGFYISMVSLFILLSSSLALAHKVNLFVSAQDGMVKTESSYPDGQPVVNGEIEVLDSLDNKLLAGKTDSDGIFSFKIPKIDDLKIVLDAKLGHKTSTFVFTEELEAGSEKKSPEDAHSEKAPAQTAGKTSAKAKRRSASRKEPFPIAAVLGGLGFIFGLTALVMQFGNKKKG